MTRNAPAEKKKAPIKPTSQSGACFRAGIISNATNSIAAPASRKGNPKRTDFQPSMGAELCAGWFNSTGGWPGPPNICWRILSAFAFAVTVIGSSLEFLQMCSTPSRAAIGLYPMSKDATRRVLAWNFEPTMDEKTTKGTRILGIESSCDETAAAVVVDGRIILSSVVASQIDIHRKYGGVVPELASREPLRPVVPVVREALEQARLDLRDVDAIAVTQGP